MVTELENDGDNLGSSLKKLRLAAGMTQEELAERAGISARTVSDVERGLRTAVHNYTAQRMASALGLADAQQIKFEALASGRHLTSEALPVARLPVIPTPLFGRTHELESISTAIQGSDVRLLTLTGPGGIGKTRLALEVARRIGGSFEGGAFFVSLGEVSEASLVAPEVAKVLGAVETGARLDELIAKRLADRHALVVLDTFEHLTAAAPLVYALLLSCPETTFLVTSRSALRLRGEREFPVPPLELPSGTGDASPEDVARWPATALFWERAQAVRPDLELDLRTATLVVEICRKLDGLPLAIELAAARVKHLPLTAVRDQLEDRLRLLVGGPLDLPMRQRAIRDTVAWSHDLLGKPEAILFRRLSAFSGGWNLTAVDAICGSIDDGPDALEGISALVDQSLVVLDRNHPDARYDMLDVVREYAAQRLGDAGETEEIAKRHALHYLALAEDAEPNLVRARHDDWFRRLDVERGNLRRAMAWTIEREETMLALRFTVALWRYWRQLGEFAEGRRWSDAALGMSAKAPASLRCKALWAASALAFPQGDYRRMAELNAEAIELARQSEEPMDMRNALTMQGLVAMCESRYGDALEPLREGLEICRRLGLSWQLGTSHLNFGMALLHAGSPEQADATFQEGLGVYRQLGDDIFAARIINGSAQAALARVDIERADSLARDALTAFAKYEERQGIADSLEILAAVAAARSDADRAGTLSGAATAVRETIASRPAPFELAIIARYTERAEKSAGKKRWLLAWETGRALSAEGAVAYALT